MVSDAGSTSAENCTCGAGLESTQCGYDGEQRCFAPCHRGQWLSASGCEYMACHECPLSYWCDGVDHYQCPGDMKSPKGSHSAENCTCHTGYTQDGDTCLECSEGSWCDGEEEYECPDGMTSNTCIVCG